MKSKCDFFRADLHCHTTASDGSDTPQNLLHLAKSCGLDGLSITDHDTVTAYDDSLFALAKELNIHLLTGVELSSSFEGVSIHVLGYNIDLQSPVLSSLLSDLHQAREERNRQILSSLKKKGIDLSAEALAKKGRGRPHIAQLLVEKGVVKSAQEAFVKYLADAPSFSLSTPLAIEAIHKSCGKAVLAHPHLLKASGKWKKRLLALPWDGIECYYGDLSPSQEAPWLQIAQEKKVIATGGSDYHGTYKPHIALGASFVTKEVFELLAR